MSKIKNLSLEALVESGDRGLQILHPGGLEMTRELHRTQVCLSAKAVVCFPAIWLRSLNLTKIFAS
jgi:hypothetical protein